MPGAVSSRRSRDVGGNAGDAGPRLRPALTRQALLSAAGGRLVMSMRLGYLVPEFPNQTHVFFWREIRALRRMGEEEFLLSTRKPSPVTCRHAFVPPALAETRHQFPPTVTRLARMRSVNGQWLAR